MLLNSYKQLIYHYLNQEEGGSAIDYNRTPLTLIQNIMTAIIVFILSTICGYIIYKSWILSCIIGFGMTYFAIPYINKRAILKRRLRFRGQFKEFLGLLSVSMRAGRNEVYSIEDSILELQMLYSADSDIVIEVKNILLRYHNGYTLRSSFNDLAKRIQLDDVTNFALIFEVIEGKGNKTLEIVTKTHAIISEKYEIEMEIETLIAGSKNEASILLVLPLVIMATMNFLGGDFINANSQIASILINSGLIAWFLAAYVLASKFMKIDI